MSQYLGYNRILNRYKVLKYDKENGALMPTHKKAELDRYERYFEDLEQETHALMRKEKFEM